MVVMRKKPFGFSVKMVQKLHLEVTDDTSKSVHVL